MVEPVFPVVERVETSRRAARGATATLTSEILATRRLGLTRRRRVARISEVTVETTGCARGDLDHRTLAIAGTPDHGTPITKSG